MFKQINFFIHLILGSGYFARGNCPRTEEVTVVVMSRKIHMW